MWKSGGVHFSNDGAFWKNGEFLQKASLITHIENSGLGIGKGYMICTAVYNTGCPKSNARTLKHCNTINTEAIYVKLSILTNGDMAIPTHMVRKFSKFEFPPFYF